MTELWIPPHPPRRPKPVPTWRGFFGERARTAVYGWSELAFDNWYFKRNILGHTVHIALKPEWVQRVLLDNAANYEKPRLVKRILSPTIGRGLLTSEGELWRAQRKIVAASFTPPAVDALMPLFGEVGQSMAASWEPGTRDMAVEATSATMRVIATALFSGDERLTTPEAMAHITAAMEGVGEARIQALLGMPMIPITPKGRHGRRGQQFLRATLGAIVRERLGSNAPDDFVTGMIHALLDRFPRDEAIELATDNAATFYLAGHETTANLTSWTLFVLSEQPELQDKVAVEAEAALGAGVDAGFPTGCPCCERSWTRRCASIRRSRASTVRPSRRTGSASMRSNPAISSRSGRGSSSDTGSCGTSRTRSIPIASRRIGNINSIASNICLSGRGRERASARVSPWPKR